MSYVKTLAVGVKKSQSNDSGSQNIGLNSKPSIDIGTNGHAGDAPKLPPKPVREQVRVIFSYTAQNEDELTIKEDDLITVISKDNEDVGWWKGELNGRIALFPDNFVEPYQPQAPPLTSTRNVPIDMNNSQAIDKLQGVKKPERPSSLAKPALAASNIETESSPAITPTSPASPASSIAPNSVASKKLKFQQIHSQFQENTQPKSAVSLSNNNVEKQVNNKKDDDYAKKSISKTPSSDDTNSSTTSAIEPGRLVHLTALRPKIPTTSRRPPSMPPRTSSLIDDEINFAEDNVSDTDIANLEIRSPTKESTTENGTISAMPIEKKPLPWLNDLVLAQKRRNPVKAPVTTATTNGSNAAITVQNTSLSGAFTNKVSSSLMAADNKPITLNKPSVPPSSTKPQQSQSTSIEDDMSTTNLTNKLSTASANIIQSATSANKDLETIADLKNDNSLLRSEMKELKADFDDLKSKYIELKSACMSQDDLIVRANTLESLIQDQKESFGAQKLALFEMVKKLINEYSDEKKKVANMEIELDRIRKLHSTIYDS